MTTLAAPGALGSKEPSVRCHESPEPTHRCVNATRPLRAHPWNSLPSDGVRSTNLEINPELRPSEILRSSQDSARKSTSREQPRVRSGRLLSGLRVFLLVLCPVPCPESRQKGHGDRQTPTSRRAAGVDPTSPREPHACGGLATGVTACGGPLTPAHAIHKTTEGQGQGPGAQGRPAVPRGKAGRETKRRPQ